MDNILSKGLLLTAAVALVGYGVSDIQTNFWYGVSAIVLGVVIFIIREWLKKQGYEIAGKKKK